MNYNNWLINIPNDVLYHILTFCDDNIETIMKWVSNNMKIYGSTYFPDNNHLFTLRNMESNMDIQILLVGPLIKIANTVTLL
jgi:hypothetical protein